jgi:hypothetical protein
MKLELLIAFPLMSCMPLLLGLRARKTDQQRNAPKAHISRRPGPTPPPMLSRSGSGGV